MTKQKPHPDHSKQAVALNRAIGQLNGVKQMIEERRYCVDILTQLHAARAAIRSLELSILNTHIGHCVTAAAQASATKKAEEKLSELKDLLKRYSE